MESSIDFVKVFFLDNLAIRQPYQRTFIRWTPTVIVGLNFFSREIEKETLELIIYISICTLTNVI